MSNDEILEFEEAKKHLYSTLGDSNLKNNENHPSNDERLLYFLLLDKIMKTLEFEHKKENGVLKIDIDGYKIKNIFPILRKLKNYILWFFYIEIYSCQFVVLDKSTDLLSLNLCFKKIDEKYWFKYFVDDTDKDMGKVDFFDQYEVVEGGLKNNYWYYDKLTNKSNVK